jgi:hypothetical protein
VCCVLCVMCCVLCVVCEFMGMGDGGWGDLLDGVCSRIGYIICGQGNWPVMLSNRERLYL